VSQHNTMATPSPSVSSSSTLSAPRTTPGTDISTISQKVKFSESTTDNGLPSPASTPQFQTSTQADMYPVFASGNMNVRMNVMNWTNHWQLHASTASRVSTWFARSVREQDDMTIETSYTYIIEEKDDHISLTLQISRVNELRSPPYDERDSLTINFKDQEERDSILRAYTQIFDAFYNIAPQLSSTDIKAATTQAEHTVSVAQKLGCITLISHYISNALLQHRQALYKAILMDAPRYLLLSLSLENTFIYTEAMIHLIGAYPCSPWPTPHTALPEATRALIALKAEKLDKQVLEVERELLLLTIVHVNGARKQPYRYDVSSEFDTWFVVQLFRDTLTGVLRSNDESRAPPLKRGGFFRKISRGGSAYMAFEDVRGMLLRVMPSAVDTLREDLNDLKAFASGVVEEVAKNELSLDGDEIARSEVVTRDGKRIKAEWLTCAKVEEKDIPWRAGGEEGG
jgi:hypothetical protein